MINTQLPPPSKQEIKQVGMLRAVLADKMEGRSTMHELMEICLDWSYFYALNGYKYRELKIPDFVLTYRVMDISVKGKQWDKPDFREKYLKWLDEEQENRNKNNSNKRWLKFMIKYYQYKKDQVKLDKVQLILNTYNT